MKKTLTILLIAVTCAGVSVTPIALTGCKTSQKTIAYKTLKAVGETVDSAMKAYADMVVRERVRLETRTKVRAMHEKYRAAYLKAIEAAHFDYKTAAPAEVASLAAELVQFIASLTNNP